MSFLELRYIPCHPLSLHYLGTEITWWVFGPMKCLQILCLSPVDCPAHEVEALCHGLWTFVLSHFFYLIPSWFWASQLCTLPFPLSHPWVLSFCLTLLIILVPQPWQPLENTPHSLIALRTFWAEPKINMFSLTLGGIAHREKETNIYSVLHVLGALQWQAWNNP